MSVSGSSGGLLVFNSALHFSNSREWHVRCALEIGQSVTATGEIPAPEGELEIPTDAVVEDGRERVGFVQPATGQIEIDLCRGARRRYNCR